MVNISNATVARSDDLGTTTDGYHDTSAHAHQMHMNRDMSTGVSWLFLNATTDDEPTEDRIATDQSTVLYLTLDVCMIILSPFILTGNGLTIIVVVQFIRKVTPTHVAVAFLAFAGLFVGMIPLFSLTFYLMGDSVYSRYIDDLNVWVTVAARTLNISAILLIAVERCFLLTSWTLYIKHLTTRRQFGLCLVFCVYSFVFATIFTLMADSELKFYLRFQMFLQRREFFVAYILFLLIYILESCILAFCYLKIYLFLWKHRKTANSSQKSSQQKIF